MTTARTTTDASGAGKARLARRCHGARARLAARAARTDQGHRRARQRRRRRDRGGGRRTTSRSRRWRSAIETYTDQAAPALLLAALPHDDSARPPSSSRRATCRSSSPKRAATARTAAQPVFAPGTIYFRHGARSEPARRADLGALARPRRARSAARLAQRHPQGRACAGRTLGRGAAAVGRRIGRRRQRRSENLAACIGDLAFVPRNAEEIWPHRQQGLLNAVNRRLPRTAWINGYDVMCVNRKYDVLKSRPDFAYKPHHLASPQYSSAYADWLVAHFRRIPRSFAKRARRIKPERSKTELRAGTGSADIRSPHTTW